MASGLLLHSRAATLSGGGPRKTEGAGKTIYVSAFQADWGGIEVGNQPIIGPQVRRGNFRLMKTFKPDQILSAFLWPAFIGASFTKHAKKGRNSLPVIWRWRAMVPDA